MLKSKMIQEAYSRNEYWICSIYVDKNPNLSRTHDIEASFTLLSTSNPYLSRGFKLGVLR